MLQRDKVAIHGGTIVKDNKAIIITGDRGAGKSTLTTALRLRNYSFLSDDVAAVEFSDHIPMINYGFPYQKLCEDAIDNFKYNRKNYNWILSDNKIKYMVKVDKTFMGKSVELFAIFEIIWSDVQDVEVVEIGGSEKLSKIIDNIYWGEYIRNLGGMTPKYLQKCFNIAKHIRVFKIIRPKNGFTVDRQIELIENILYKETL